MTLKLYMDEHIPQAITQALRLRDFDILTVQEDHQPGVDDSILLSRATELNRVIFTRDEDFLVEAQKRQKSSDLFSGVIYAHQKISLKRCIEDLILIISICEADELQNQVQYLPLKN